MNYDVYIGDYSFSSWSLRGWLMFKAFGIPCKTHLLGLYSPDFKTQIAPFAPARTVPFMRNGAGHLIQDTLAMAETLHENHPNVGLWPKRADQRAFARGAVAEMHAGFAALRRECPMDLSTYYADFQPSPAVQADVARIEALWQHAFEMKQDAASSWAFDHYSLMDVFYAPVAMRIAGYGLPVSRALQAYVQAHLEHPLIRQWRAMGQTMHYDPHPYRGAQATGAWPGPASMSAQAVSKGPSENKHCPYSGEPPTHFMQLDGRIFGFCNSFCRDKTVSDPAAWPAFMDIYHS